MEKMYKKILSIVLEYEASTGKEPLALLLGPKELLELTEEMKAISLFATTSSGLVIQYYGIPVKLKNTPGIDLQIPLDDIMGVLK